MTIKEVKEIKILAENKIVDILNQLERDTECSVSCITITNVEEEGFGTHAEITVNKKLNILLEF